MAKSDIDDYYRCIDCRDDRALERLTERAHGDRDHDGCRDYSDRKVVRFPFRAPQPGMFEAITAALGSDSRWTCCTVYDATTDWALHFEKTIDADHVAASKWHWYGPCLGGDSFDHWPRQWSMPLPAGHLRLFWWDGERLHEVSPEEHAKRCDRLRRCGLTVIAGGAT